MSDLHKLASQMSKMAKEVEKESAKHASSLALIILRIVPSETPVDTSKAISNWQVGIGSPPNSQIEAHFEGLAGSTYSSSLERTYDLGSKKLKNRKVGQVIYISNNADYIGKLNAGSSKQAPQGFIEAGVLKAVSIFRNSKNDRD